MNFDTAGGRRYVLVWAVYVGSSVLLWFGKLDSANYAMLMVATVAAYITGNVWQKKVEAAK